MRYLILLILFIFIPAHADLDVSIWADGYDWCFEYSEQQQRLLVSSIYEYLDVRDIFAIIETGVFSLDYFYYELMDRAKAQGLPAEPYLEIKAVDVFKRILDTPLYMRMTSNLDLIIADIENE